MFNDNLFFPPHIASAAESVDQIVLENDPLLRIEDDELEAWSISVDKKVSPYNIDK